MDDGTGQTVRTAADASGDSILGAVAYMAELLLRPGLWTDHLVPALQCLGLSVGADRLHVLQCTRDAEGRDGLTCIADWIRPGARLRSCIRGEVCAWEVQGLSRWVSILGSGMPLDGPVADLPEPERTRIGDQGTLSIATVPIFVGEEWWGIIGIDDCTSPRTWSSGEKESLALAARLISNGIQRQRAEAAIADLSALEKAIIDRSPIGISVRDRHGRLLRFNEAWKRIWAMTDEDIQDDMTRERGRLPLDPTHSYLGPYADDVLRVFTEGGAVTVPEAQTCAARPGAARWVCQRFLALPDEGGNVSRVVILTEDVSSRRQAEEHASPLVEQLKEGAHDLEQRVDRRTAELKAANEELRAFTYSVSHDLRAPLRVIDGFSAALIEDYMDQLPAEALRYARRVRSSAQEMGVLIDRMLELSRLTGRPIERRLLRVNDVVQEALEAIRRTGGGAPSEVESAASVSASGKASLADQLLRAQIVIGDLGDWSADPLLLRHVYINLIGNAIKFSRDRANPLVEIGRDGDVFFVRDNGVGFPMEYASKLFRPFQRLHSPQEFEGTGVGLTIVQRIIRSHGGRIWAEAAEGEGACFRFTLGNAGEDQEKANAP